MSSHTVFNSLPDLVATSEAGAELTCLEEVRQFLFSKGLHDRFGICLLHKHFDLSPGELMVEVVSECGTLRRRIPVLHPDPSTLTPMTWRLDVDDPLKNGAIYHWIAPEPSTTDHK